MGIGGTRDRQCRRTVTKMTRVFWLKWLAVACASKAAGVVRVLVLVGVFAGLPGGLAGAAESLVLLARPGPWSAVSGLIGYGGRLWFVNGVLFVNHNSADVYTYDPATGAARHETHLFSQNAGDPTVAGGLLYWPFEDPRSSTGRGEFMVTDGEQWSWHLLPEGQAFHVHAMLSHENTLYAATSAWRAGLQRSDDGGRTWRILYDHTQAPGTVSRFTTLATLGGRLYAGLTNWSRFGIKLFRVGQEGVAPVVTWPEGLAVTALTAFQGWLYGVQHGESESVLWRTDGDRAQSITGFEGARVRDLAATDDGLWAVSVRTDGGDLWSSPDGVTWTLRQSFEGVQPTELAVYGGHVYMGAIGPGEHGSLWGPPPPAPAEVEEIPLPLVTPGRVEGKDVDAALDALDGALAAGEGFSRDGEGLRGAVRAVARYGGRAIGEALAARLANSGPDTPVKLFGGNVEVPAATLGQWYLLWGMAYSGSGRVPTGLLTAPWDQPRNRAEKYMEPAPLAMWAAARLGQDDATTVGALVDTLGRPGDPAWLDGDRVGALTALTDRRFAYDFAAWRAWWASRH